MFPRAQVFLPCLIKVYGSGEQPYSVACRETTEVRNDNGYLLPERVKDGFGEGDYRAGPGQERTVVIPCTSYAP